MIIDAHHHLSRDPDYADKLAETCAKLGISQVWAMALPTLWGWGDNDTVERAFKKYPKLIVGFGWVHLGVEGPDKVRELKDRGFRGLKFIHPKRPYDDGRLYPVYEKAAELKMPGLFHLGIVARRDGHPEALVNSGYMRPVHLDAIARVFPTWNMIGAHLGNPWHKEAGMVCRWNHNLYFDLSGSTLKCTPFDFLGQVLWWRRDSRYRDVKGRDAWEKIVFASDVPYHEIHDVMNDYRMLMDALEIKKNIRDKIWGKTAASILK